MANTPTEKSPYTDLRKFADQQMNAGDQSLFIEAIRAKKGRSQRPGDLQYQDSIATVPNELSARLEQEIAKLPAKLIHALIDEIDAAQSPKTSEQLQMAHTMKLNATIERNPNQQELTAIRQILPEIRQLCGITLGAINRAEEKRKSAGSSAPLLADDEFTVDPPQGEAPDDLDKYFV